VSEQESLKTEIAQTRDDLAETVEQLAAKADVKERAKASARDAAAVAKVNTQLAVDRATQSVQRRPGRWAAVAGATVAAVVAIVLLRSRRR